jgi:hypothetical protein
MNKRRRIEEDEEFESEDEESESEGETSMAPYKPILWYAVDSDGRESFLPSAGFEQELAKYIRQECQTLRVWNKPKRETSQRNPNIGSVLAKWAINKENDRRKIKIFRDKKNNQKTTPGKGGKPTRSLINTGEKKGNFHAVEKSLKRALSTGNEKEWSQKNGTI